MHQLVELFTGSSSKAKKLKRNKSAIKAQLSKSVPSSKLSGEDDPTEGITAVGAKDATLFLFRALGKVLYCKRKYSILQQFMLSCFIH